jgi:ATP-dependent helicase HrpA
MHARFRVPGSDFLGFLKLWDTYAGEWATLKTQNRMRKFCKDHFLSFSRMQEWHDVHGQIHEALDRMSGFEENKTPATFDAIHRSLLTGLLSNCARRNDKGKYEASRGRELTMFPGSALSGQKPDWIVCHQMLETSQLFAHTCTPINPAWLEELAGDLCTRNYGDPWFDEETGVVRATGRVSLFGMQIAEHPNTVYAHVNIEWATEVFIREALINERLRNAPRFLTHNKGIRREIETLEAKMRTRTLFAGETAMFEFYRSRISDAGSIHDLNRIIKEKGSDDFLRMTREDLLTTGVPDEAVRFPDTVTIGTRQFEVSYAFEPGRETDGVTMKIHAADAPIISQAMLPYLIPALWPARIEEMIRTLPKELRKQLMPIAETASTLASMITVSQQPFELAVVKAIRERYHIVIAPALLGETALPPHLAVRIEIVGADGKTITASRETETLKQAMATATVSDARWEREVSRHERRDIVTWDFGDLPETIEVAAVKGSVPLFGYPALSGRGESIDVRVFPALAEAQTVHRSGVARLLERQLASEFAWIDRDCKFTKEIRLQCTPLGGADEVRRLLLDSIRSYILAYDGEPPRSAGAFNALIAEARKKAVPLGNEAVSLTGSILRLYQDCLAALSKIKEGAAAAIKKELRADLDRYLLSFRCGLPFTRLRQYPRYLQAFRHRIARAINDPAKYRRNREQLAVFYQKPAIEHRKEIPPALSLKLDEYHAMIEEFAISLFAQQEVKTLFPISEQRLAKKAAEIEHDFRGCFR